MAKAAWEPELHFSAAAANTSKPQFALQFVLDDVALRKPDVDHVPNFVPSAWIPFSVLARGENVPGLTAVLTESQLQALGDEALAAANSIGVYANGLSVAFSLLFAIAIWKGLLRRTKWVFWALAASTLVALLGGVGADYVVGFRFPELNLISGLLLAIGFACCASEILSPAARRPED